MLYIFLQEKSEVLGDLQKEIFLQHSGTDPGENYDGEHINRTAIIKIGNDHLRLLLTETFGGICRGTIGYN